MRASTLLALTTLIISTTASSSSSFLPSLSFYLAPLPYLVYHPVTLSLYTSHANTPAGPPSFCKCTCLTNSTIIELTPPPSADKSQSFLHHIKRFFPFHPPTIDSPISPPSDNTGLTNDLAGRDEDTLEGNGDTEEENREESEDSEGGTEKRFYPFHPPSIESPIGPPSDNTDLTNDLVGRDSSPSDDITPVHHPLQKRGPPAACSRCNRAFCLSLNLPICKNAVEADVTTNCFQRDSRKDQLVVWGFLLTVLGLLGWAGGKSVVARGKERRGVAYQQVARG